MTRLAILAPSLAAMAVALAACNPPHPQPPKALAVLTKLDCPASQGGLTRQSVAADGLSCAYSDGAGNQVALRLVSLDGKDAQTALAPIEAQLQAEVPAGKSDGDGDGDASASASASGKDGKDGDKTGDKTVDKDKVDIDLPGIHIHARGDGHSDVDAGGVRVHAHGDDKGGTGSGANTAQVKIDGGSAGGVVVNADDGGAQVRLNKSGSGVDNTVILTSDTPGPHGFKTAGYEARGPHSGPLVVATVLARSDVDDSLHHDARALLKHNLGD